MSYEGYEELICEVGHLSFQGQWDNTTLCDCGKKIRFVHMVDQTNGIVEGDSTTLPAPKKVIGFEDVWHEDHYGNKYATKLLKYEPASIDWSVNFISDNEKNGFNRAKQVSINYIAHKDGCKVHMSLESYMCNPLNRPTQSEHPEFIDGYILYLKLINVKSWRE